jgi:hypothetical protein
MTEINPREFAERLAALWNEPDAEARREAIRALWAEDGTHLLQPPLAMRETATGLGFFDAVLEARGYDEIEARVTRGHEHFLAPHRAVVVAGDNADRLGDVVKFNLGIVREGGGPATALLEILVLDSRGRIRTDHQFFETAATP